MFSLSEMTWVIVASLLSRETWPPKARMTYSSEYLGTSVLRQNRRLANRRFLFSFSLFLNSSSILYRSSSFSPVGMALNSQPWQVVESCSAGGYSRPMLAQSLQLTNLRRTMQKSRKVDMTRQSTSMGRLAGYLKGTMQVIFWPMTSDWQYTPLMLTNTFLREFVRITQSSKCLSSLLQRSILSPLRLNSLCVGKMVKSAMRERGSSRSLRASTNCGQRSLTRWLRVTLGLCLAKYWILPMSPLALAFLNLRRQTFCSLSLSMMGSRARKLISLRWQQVLLVFLSFLGGSRGQTPLRMQSLLKSLRDNCSFLMALALLTYLITSPRLPAFILRIDVIVENYLYNKIGLVPEHIQPV